MSRVSIDSEQSKKLWNLDLMQTLMLPRQHTRVIATLSPLHVYKHHLLHLSSWSLSLLQASINHGYSWTSATPDPSPHHHPPPPCLRRRFVPPPSTRSIQGQNPGRDGVASSWWVVTRPRRTNLRRNIDRTRFSHPGVHNFQSGYRTRSTHNRACGYWDFDLRDVRVDGSDLVIVLGE